MLNILGRKSDLVALQLNLADLSVFGHRHERAVIHIADRFPRKIRGNDAVNQQNDEDHDDIVKDQWLLWAFDFLHAGFLLE